VNATILSERVTGRAEQLLIGGRVAVMRVDRGAIQARVLGDHGNYVVAGDSSGLRCSCPARGECAHLLAVAIVTTGPWKD
jgi:uncharacterized Zn finger protein